MKYCKKCGYANSNDSNYCRSCGNGLKSGKSNTVLYIILTLAVILLVGIAGYILLIENNSKDQVVSKAISTTTTTTTTTTANGGEKNQDNQVTTLSQVQTQIQVQTTQAPRKIITAPTGIGGIVLPDYEGQPEFTLRDHHAQWTQALANMAGVSVNELEVSYFNDSAAAVYFRDKAVGVLKMDPYRRHATMYQGDFNGQLNY